MKRKLAILGALLATHLAFGQGTFVYDQQSSDVNHFDGDDSVPIPFWGAPPVQSFTPSLSGIGFIEVWGMDIPTFTALAVNLRESSPDGAILGTTSTVTIPRGTNYSGPLSFLFSGQISLVPGQVYYMEPFMVKPAGYGTSCHINAFYYNYAGGRYIDRDNDNTKSLDLWFREGIVVPEPGTMALVLLGASCFIWRRRRQ